MSKKYVWYLLLAGSTAAVGAIYPLTKLLAVDYSPLSLAFLRYFIAIIPITPFFIFSIRKQRKNNPNNSGKAVSTKDTLLMLALGLLGVGVFSTLFFIGVDKSTGTNGSVIVNTQPIFAVFLTPLLLKEKFMANKLAAVVVGLFGMVLVVTNGSFSALDLKSEVLSGNIILIGASLSLSIGTILLKPYIVKYGGIIPTFLTFASGAAFLALFVWIIQGSLVSLRGITLRDVLFLLFIGVVCTSLFFLIFNKAIHVVGVVETIGFKLLIPVSGVILSVLILRERPNWITLAGTGLVIACIVFLQFGLKKLKLEEGEKL